MRTAFASVLALSSALVSQAQTDWSVLNIPNSGRYDDVYFINADTGWAAGGPNGWIRRTVNGGQSWTLQYDSPSYLRSIEFMNADTGFAGSLNGELFRTINGGASWTDISPNMAPAPMGICGLSAPGMNMLYACGLWAAPAYIYESGDAGANWSYTDMSGLATRLVDIHFTHPDTGFATGTADPPSNGGVILYTDNGGESWTTVHTTNTLTDIVWKIQRLDALNWYASIYSEPTNDDTRMLKSTDGGMTWTLITVANTYTYVEAVGFIDPLRGWMGGEDILWETIDGGASWEQIALGHNYNRFFRVNDSTAYLSGQRIYKYEGDITTGTTLSEPRSVMHTLEVSPNPTQGRISIRVELEQATIADVSILAPDGSAVKQLMHRKTEPGRYNYEVDLSALPSATYCVVLKTNEGMQYRKVVVE